MPDNSHFARAATCLPMLLAGGLAAQAFTVVGLPDTQRYSELYPAIFQSQTQWIATQMAARSIRYVSHYGDVVQHGDSITEWNNADLAMTTLDVAGVPYGVTAGNHDITPSGVAGSSYIPANFTSFFGPQRFAGKAWYRGASPSGMSSYQVFDGHGLQFLALHLECDPAMRELEWAQGILHENRDKPVLLTTHRYLQDAEDYTAGVPLVPSGRYPDIWYGIEGLYVPGGTRSEDLWNWFVRRNPNILLVQCGHFHEEFRQTSTNAYGRAVHEVLADYQDDPNGGNGFLRVMTFDLGNHRIDVDSYSPWLDASSSAAESDFTLPVMFSDYYSLEPTVVLQQGIAGYQGCQDTWLDQDQPGTVNGSAATIVVDDDVTNSPFQDRRAQGLIRFDGLFGAPGSGRIPAGAQIVSAWLTLEVVEDIDAPSLPDFLLHRVLIDWNEQSTWNTLGGGLQVGSELAPNPIVIRGDNNRDGDGLRHLDVTAMVQAWANGAPNHGFAIVPEIIPLKDDGIEIASREHGNPLLRPRLEVTYDSACGFSTYGVGQGAANWLQLRGLGLPRVGRTIELTTTNGPAAATLTAFAAAAANGPLFDGVLHLDPAALIDIRFGSPTQILSVPPLPQFAGTAFYFQSFAFDPSQPQGFALSNGLAATLCR
jgi:hypothetical protein